MALNIILAWLLINSWVAFVVILKLKDFNVDDLLLAALSSVFSFPLVYLIFKLFFRKANKKWDEEHKI